MRAVSPHACALSQLFFQDKHFSFFLFLLLRSSACTRTLDFLLLMLACRGCKIIHRGQQPCPPNKQKIPYVLEGGISYRPFSLSLSFNLSQLKLYFRTAVTIRHCKLKTSTWALSSEALSGPDRRHGGEISSALKLQYRCRWGQGVNGNIPSLWHCLAPAGGRGSGRAAPVHTRQESAASQLMTD